MGTKASGQRNPGQALLLKEFRVFGLFGTYNHRIPMHDCGVTIIHGPNGYGKTITLRILNAILEGRYEELRNLPFESAQADFSDGSQLVVAREQQVSSDNLRTRRVSRQRRVIRLAFNYSKNGKSEAPFYPHPRDPRRHPRVEYLLDAVESVLPSLSRVGFATWFDADGGDNLNATELLARYEKALPDDLCDALAQFVQEPGWLEQIQSHINTHLITADRLHRGEVANAPRYESAPAEKTDATISYYAESLARQTKRRLAELSLVSGGLDRTFPKRVFDYWQKREREQSKYLTRSQMMARLDMVNGRRQELVRAGIAPPGELIDWTDVPDSTNARRMLAVYLDDMESKTEVVIGAAQRTNLFMDLVNERLLHKEIVVDEEHGFMVHPNKGTAITPDKLSSGEQHLIVLTYELLFEIEDGGLVLIDEPELSLHVSWQMQFLKDLERIRQLKPLQVLIATHSPQIVNDAWEQMVSLVDSEGSAT